MLKTLWTITGCVAAVVAIGFLIGIAGVAFIRVIMSIKSNKGKQFFVLSPYKREKLISEIAPGDFFYHQ